VIEYLLLGGAALGGFAWERLRRRRYAKQYKAFLATLSDEAQVVLHVANHEATTRSQHLAPAHLAYGLLQDESFIAAVKELGGDPEALEASALAAIEAGSDVPFGQVPEAVMVIAHSAATAQNAKRTASIADLFGHLCRTAGSQLFDVPPLTRAELLFLLVHGTKAPSMTLPGERDVFVVIRNDDFTTRELVVKILLDVFRLPPDEAERVMMTANDDGRAVVGRFASEVARDRIETARRKAIDAASPLWIGVEPT
jgi:ATP-dependent Clp protease adaptor protein ClpS